MLSAAKALCLVALDPVSRVFSGRPVVDVILTDVQSEGVLLSMPKSHFVGFFSRSDHVLARAIKGLGGGAVFHVWNVTGRCILNQINTWPYDSLTFKASLLLSDNMLFATTPEAISFWAQRETGAWRVLFSCFPVKHGMQARMPAEWQWCITGQRQADVGTYLWWTSSILLRLAAFAKLGACPYDSHTYGLHLFEGERCRTLCGK